MVIARDPPAIAVFALMGSLFVLFTGVGRESLPAAVAEEPDVFDILPAAELSLDQMDARPGGVLVLVRNPHSLAHVAAALQAPPDRDVVVMTVRLLGVDVSADGFSDAAPTLPNGGCSRKSRFWPNGTIGRCVSSSSRPTTSSRAIVATILRLRSSDVHVGESSTLSADEQARLLGNAWEKAARAEPLDVRLVVHHRSGRTDTYHLGAHPPSLLPAIWIPSTASGWMRPKPSGHMSIITTSSGRRSRKWNNN